MPNPDLETMRESAQDQTHTGVERAAAAAHETVDRVQRRAHDVADRVSTQADRYYQSGTQWIADHPLQALVAALTVGYLVGRLRR